MKEELAPPVTIGNITMRNLCYAKHAPTVMNAKVEVEGSVSVEVDNPAMVVVQHSALHRHLVVGKVFSVLAHLPFVQKDTRVSTQAQ